MKSYQREILIDELRKMKEQYGFRVFICTSGDYCYGIITDGIEIVSVCEGTGGGFLMAYEYIPSREYGNGCGDYDYFAIGKSHLTKEMYDAAVKYGREFSGKYGIQRYSGIDHYMNDEWHQRSLMEISMSGFRKTQRKKKS